MPLRLYRRGDIWHLRGTVAGKFVRESTRVGDRRAAEIIRARRETEILEQVTLGRQATVTFAEAALTYLESGGERRFLAPILQHFGPRTRLADIDNAAVAACARAIYPTAADATINRQVITPISAVLNLAAEEGLCAPRQLRRRKGDTPRLRWLTPAEAEALLDACDARTAAMVAWLLGTGCRVSEMLMLTAPDLYLESQEAWIPETKNGHPRMVEFPTRTKRLLAATGLPQEGAVFRTPKGKPYRIRENVGGQIQSSFNRARDAAGLGRDVTPHVLRHTWATYFYSQTQDFGRLMDLGGWQKADMANRYRKIAPAWLRADLLRYGWDFSGAPAPSDQAGNVVFMSSRPRGR